LDSGFGPAPKACVRRNAARRLAAAGLILWLVAAGACSAPGVGTPSASGAVPIPTGNLSAFDRCMLDAGFEIVGVHSTGPGEAPEYDFRLTTTGLDPDEVQARIHQCEVLQPSHPPLTEAEIRQTYDRWVGEYHCLMGLGYQPDPPPSFETFLASYDAGNHKSPWMPTDGIDTAHWTQAQYDEAKAKCSLEFFTMEW
jgi:hypothetical protein